jgi:hypothetical protein
MGLLNCFCFRKETLQPPSPPTPSPPLSPDKEPKTLSYIPVDKLIIFCDDEPANYTHSININAHFNESNTHLNRKQNVSAPIIKIG